MPKKLVLRTYCNDEALVKERRDHILLHSAKLLVKRGYAQTNMRELAQACGMSIGVLYYYFGSKEEILYSIINNASSVQADHIENFANTLIDVSPTEALSRLFERLCQWHDDNQDVTLFAYQETKSLTEDARLSIFNSERRITAVFEKLLRKGVDAGEFGTGDPSLMAHNIVVLAHAWALRRWYLRKHWDFHTHLSEQTDIILKAVKTKDVN